MSEYVETASDLNVEGVEFFAKENSSNLYKDAEYENIVDFETLKHAFEMNDVVVVDSGAKYRPAKFEVKKDNSNKDYAEISYVTTYEDVESGETVVTVKSLRSASVE